MGQDKKLTDELNYRPITDWGAVTGSRVSRERINKLVEFKFNNRDDLTNDDLFAVHSEMFKRIFYAFAIAGEQLWNEEKLHSTSFPRRWEYSVKIVSAKGGIL